MIPLPLQQQLALLQYQQLQAAMNSDKSILALYSNWLMSGESQQGVPQYPHTLPPSSVSPAMSDAMNAFYQQLILTPSKSMIPFAPVATPTVPIPSPAISPSSKKRKSPLEEGTSASASPLSVIDVKRPCSSGTTASTPTSVTTSSSVIITNDKSRAPDNHISQLPFAAPAPVKARPDSNSQSDTEPDEFIDVVGEALPKTKVQRKAHIDFYRKLKLLRNREKKLKCALCSEHVLNVENSIRDHITSHADASMLICKICCYSSRELNQMFKHMLNQHPTNQTCYEDRRNMMQLCELLSSCFPRSGVTKQRTGYMDLVQKLIDTVKKSDANKNSISCNVCKKSIDLTKEALTRHSNMHHVYRCKKCKTVIQDEEQMQQHCTSEHAEPSPTTGVHYHVSTAADAVTGAFKRCFEAS